MSKDTTQRQLNNGQIMDLREHFRRERWKRAAGWVLLIALVVAGMAVLSWYLG